MSSANRSLRMIFAAITVMAVMGCQNSDVGRNTSTPEHAYVGHWKNEFEGAVTNDYINSDGTLTRVWSDGLIYKFNWSVASQNTEQRTIHVQLINAVKTNLRSSRTLTFAPDYMSFKHGNDTSRWTYVDAKLNP